MSFKRRPVPRAFPVVEKYCATNRWQFTCQAMAQQLPEQEISK
jgi:hypothetical protein